jgi:outer membrane protein insertion porin family
MIKLFTIFLFIFSSISFAELVVDKVEIDCLDNNCQRVFRSFKSLTGKYESISNLEKILKIYTINQGIYKFSYELINTGKNQHLKLLIGVKPVVHDVDIVFVKDSIDIPVLLPLSPSSFLDENKVSESVEAIKRLAAGKGYPNARVQVKSNLRKDKSIDIDFIVGLGTPRRLSEINYMILPQEGNIRELADKFLMSYLNTPFDQQDFKQSVDKLKDTLFDFGYYLVDIDFNYRNIGQRNVVAQVDISLGNKYVFDLSGNTYFSIHQLRTIFKDNLKVYKRQPTIESIRSTVQSQYKSAGFKDVKVDVTLSNYSDLENSNVERVKIDIDEGRRFMLSRLEFKGNSFFKIDELEKMFYANAFSQAKNGIYDEKYYTFFQDYIYKQYLEKGFVDAKVDSPLINIEDDMLTVSFRIREGARAIINKVDIQGLSDELKIEIEKSMVNKTKKAFNPLVFQDDLNMIENTLKNKGYYFTQIKNLDSTDLVIYRNDNSQVDIKIDIELTEKIFLDNIIIIGNVSTNTKIVEREILIQRGDVITPDAIRRTYSNILGLNLFSQVNIKPIIKSNSRSDLLIILKEKDFGIIEFAPGFRTDLGPKLGGGINYLNLWGEHWIMGVKGQVNRRVAYDTLDPRRRSEEKDILEHYSRINFNKNYIFDSPLGYSGAISTTRRRYYSFDADISRISNTVSWDIDNYWSVSLRQQYETISQFDATLDRDNGDFQIGGVTPGVIWDLRDNRINPTQGAYFNLSLELANPTFLSQSNEDLEINFYKIVSRNKFYAKIPNGVLALSMVAGVEENLNKEIRKDSDGNPIMVGDRALTRGYIPDIKVFRLTGSDIVRGFEDGEINRLVNGQDISEVLVTDRAYMMNLKVEPRFYINDSSMIGIFYDAGRVFVDEYDLNELRSSVGLSYKYLTPVGSLDIDYGIKLLRKRDSNGTLESPGRLHVSIGFF